MKWIDLTDTATLNILQENSKTENSTFLIFKHSTRCGTSRMALKNFESSWDESLPAYLVYVVEDRRVSNEIEKIYGTSHQSPQVLLVKNGKCVYDASHSHIDIEDILRAALSE